MCSLEYPDLESKNSQLITNNRTAVKLAFPIIICDMHVCIYTYLHIYYFICKAHHPAKMHHIGGRRHFAGLKLCLYTCFFHKSVKHNTGNSQLLLKYMEASNPWGLPENPWHSDRIFHEINHPAIGVHYIRLWKSSYEINGRKIPLQG